MAADELRGSHLFIALHNLTAPGAFVSAHYKLPYKHACDQPVLSEESSHVCEASQAQKTLSSVR